MTHWDPSPASPDSGAPPDPRSTGEATFSVRPLPASALLDVWERGQGAAPAVQGELLLVAACPDAPPGALARLPVGRRDARLFELRSLIFGDRLEGVVRCPVCGEVLELDFPLEGLRAGAPSGERGARASGPTGAGPRRDADLLSVVHDGYTVRFRLPTVADLAALGEAWNGEVGMGDEEESGPVALLARCVVEARRGDEALEAAALPETVVTAVAERMEREDPQASPRLDLACPACAHRWESPFDIVTWLWTEIDGWARRTLREVHDLAWAYGWREADILAMSAGRRRGYLDLVRG